MTDFAIFWPFAAYPMSQDIFCHRWDRPSRAPARNGSSHRWIVTAVDHLTRYADTAPLRSSSASEVAAFFLDTIVLRHGAHHVLSCDRDHVLSCDQL